MIDKTTRPRLPSLGEVERALEYDSRKHTLTLECAAGQNTMGRTAAATTDVVERWYF